MRTLVILLAVFVGVNVAILAYFRPGGSELQTVRPPAEWGRPAPATAKTALAIPFRSSPGPDPREWIDAELDGLVALYEHFHQYPELSGEERVTAQRVADELDDAGLDVTTGVGGHGVVGILEDGDGPMVMIRGDMDALPVVEETGLEYASQVRSVNASGNETGVMHACGHDLHVTALIGVGRYLAAHREEWAGRLMLVAQPAEESGSGAAAMLDDGLFSRFSVPDAALALHVDAELPAGFIGYRSGYAMANVDIALVTMHGKSAHSATPHLAIDPITQAAQLVLDLQNIVSREINPQQPAVISVGTIHAGTTSNIIPDSCKLELTIRTFDAADRTAVRESVYRKARAIAQGHSAPEPTIVYHEGVPALYNDERLVERLVPLFERLFGPERVVPVAEALTGEDFSRFGRDAAGTKQAGAPEYGKRYGRAGVPSVLFRVGSVGERRLEGFAAKGEKPPPLHSPRYFPDSRPTLKAALRAMIAAALDLMPPREQRALAAAGASP